MGQLDRAPGGCHGGHDLAEQRDLGLGERTPAGRVGHGQVAEQPAQAQAGGVRPGGERGGVRRGAADAAHARVHLEVHGRRAPEPCGDAGDLVDGVRGDDREVDVRRDAGRDLGVGQGVAELQGGEPDAGVP